MKAFSVAVLHAVVMTSYMISDTNVPLLNFNRPRDPVLTRDLKVRATADDHGVIGITNDHESKTVCLNTAMVDTAICQVIEQGEFLTYKSEALLRELWSCKRK